MRRDEPREWADGFFAIEENWGYGPTLDIVSCFRENPSPRDVTEALTASGVLRGPYRGIPELLTNKVNADGIKENVVSFCLLVLEVGVLGASLFLERHRNRTQLNVWIPPQHVKRVSATYPWNRNATWIDASVISLFESIIGFVRSIHRSLPLKKAIIEDEAYMINPPDEIEGIVVAEDFAGPPGYLGARKYRIPDCPQPERHHSFAIIDL